MKPVGLLVMHYGTPATMDDVLPYYTHIRRGRPPTEEQLHDLTSRYEAIGGPSPLTEISLKQAESIQREMIREGIPAQLYVGTKHAPPFVGDAVRQMLSDGLDRAVALVLAPHFSSFSVEAYKKYATGALNANGSSIKITFVDRWGTMPEFINALADRVRQAMADWNPSETLVIFTAHSLPERIVADGDPYKDELLETSRLVAQKADLQHWTFAFQSASDTGEPWLGPDVLEVLSQNAPRFRNVIVCTVGFVSDHLEVLYDLGIEAKVHSETLGLNFRRAETINADPDVMSGLARMALNAL